MLSAKPVFTARAFCLLIFVLPFTFSWLVYSSIKVDCEGLKSKYGQEGHKDGREYGTCLGMSGVPWCKWANAALSEWKVVGPIPTIGDFNYYPGQKNWDSHAPAGTGTWSLEHARACSLTCVACLDFFGQGSMLVHLKRRSLPVWPRRLTLSLPRGGGGGGA